MDPNIEATKLLLLLLFDEKQEYKPPQRFLHCLLAINTITGGNKKKTFVSFFSALE